jgi:Na+(H+)/acetate symporter ActP
MESIPFLFVVAMIAATIYLGIRATRAAQSASDFFVAGRSVSVFWNASAISGEYLSAASFMGIAGLVMKNGYDALWYPVGYAAGYLLLLLFIAGPLRRFGAYTIPDFAEGRFDSPTFRKVAVIFVLCIGFFYTMPQMKGAGITMASILGWPYWVGIAVVGAVITFNVALGGMKGITFVQAFQYWAKMFAISVPVFVLMAVYGGYGKTLGTVAADPKAAPRVEKDTTVKWPGKDKAPANTATFSTAGETTLLFPDGFALASATLTPRPKPDQNPPPNRTAIVSPQTQNDGAVTQTHTNLFAIVPDEAHPANTSSMSIKGIDNFAVDKGETQNSCLLTVTPYPATTGGAWQGRTVVGGTPVLQNGGPVITTVKVAFSRPTSGVLSAGSYVPNAQSNAKWLNPYGTLAGKYGYPLLYTYSLIIALICGTAGLPHILVRFYTNPDGRAAKRTTFWVMVLLGAFYVFTPLWGALGRAVHPALYANSRTDAVVIALPRLLENKLLGEILAGITSAGAFAAFMSTFSGLLVSMSGAVAHDIYGKMLKPHATAQERLRAFKIAAVVVGLISMGLGLLVETFDIALLVGWAFAIAAASYFPLLLLGAWWRGLTKQGAAAGMLLGGTLSLLAIIVFMLIDKKVLTLDVPPLAKALMEQPAIWAVPLSIGIMVAVSLATRRAVPADISLKMLRLHAPEEMGLSKNYIDH